MSFASFQHKIENKETLPKAGKPQHPYLYPGSTVSWMNTRKVILLRKVDHWRGENFTGGWLFKDCGNSLFTENDPGYDLPEKFYQIF